MTAKLTQEHLLKFSSLSLSEKELYL